MPNLQQEARDGFEAKQILESPVLQSYFEGVRANLINEIGSNANLTAQNVKDLQMWLIHLNRFEQHLQSYVETGEMARIQLEEEQA
jgi:hypothetical protein